MKPNFQKNRQINLLDSWPPYDKEPMKAGKRHFLISWLLNKELESFLHSWLPNGTKIAY